jgi:hypothetical protein
LAVIRNKYLRHKTITQVEYMSGDSHFWSGLMKIKNDLLRMGKFIVGDGSQTCSREDAWLDNTPFKKGLSPCQMFEIETSLNHFFVHRGS